ncbi:MAG TPA: hypothetical protein VFF07_16535, partial [Actinomycetota bacterium]|nr:hypothetical protein [Actinomycetota bacterium]
VWEVVGRHGGNFVPQTTPQVVGAARLGAGPDGSSRREPPAEPDWLRRRPRDRQVRRDRWVD